MYPPTRFPRSVLPFRVFSEPLEPRLLLATGPAYLVKDVNAVTTPSSPFSFIAFQGATYFRADDGVQRVSASTNTSASTWPFTMAALGSKLVFAARQPDSSSSSGRELYITDGTPAGTTQLKNINPSGGSYPGLTGFGNPDVA